MGVLPGSEGGPTMTTRPPLPGPAAFAPRGYAGGYTMRPSFPPGSHFRGRGGRGGRGGYEGGPPRHGGPPGEEGVEGDDFDGKRPRKSVMRKTVDYNSSFMGMIERRVWQRDHRDRRALQADVLHYPGLNIVLKIENHSKIENYSKIKKNLQNFPSF